MSTGFAPRGTTPFDSIRAARERVPKRYPAIGLAILGVYVAGTTIAAVLHFGMELYGPVEELTPPKPAAVESPKTFMPGDETEKGLR